MKKQKSILAVSLCFAFVVSVAMANGSMTLAALWTKSSPAVLVERSVKLVAENGLAMLEVEDTFFNPLPFQAEGLYRFNMPSGAFAGGLWINTDGKEWVPGEIRAIEEARRIYHGITARMIDPGLMEQHDSELVIRVFPAEAESNVAIRFRCYFPESFGSERFVIPVGFASLVTDRRFNGAPEHIIKFSLEASFTDSAGIKNFSTNYDKAKIVSEGKTTKLSMQVEQMAMQDLIISYDAPVSQVAIDIYEGTAQRKYSLIRLSEIAMPQDESVLKLGVILDTSGSMGELNRKRALIALDSLVKAENVDMRLFSLDDSGLSPTSPGGIADMDFYGSASWSAFASFQNENFDAVMVISDAHDLRSSHLSLLWRQIGKKPVWLTTVGEKYSATLAMAGAEFGGYTPIGRTQNSDEIASAIAASIRTMRIAPVLMSPKNQAVKPLYGMAEQRAYFVLPFEAGNYKLSTRSGGELLSFDLDETRKSQSIHDWFVHFAVRQRIVQLMALDQTPEVVRRVTDLGLRYSQTTDYTAFVAVPDEIARQHSDVFNPAYLAMFAAPNFRRARSQARGRACWANQRVLMGAVEMLVMDETDPDLAHDRETGEFDHGILVEKRYLRAAITPPEHNCDYRLIGDIKGNFLMLCLVHGSVGYPDQPIGAAIEQFCAEHGLDSSDFDVPEDLFGVTAEDPLAPVMRAASVLMQIILLMI